MSKSKRSATDMYRVGQPVEFMTTEKVESNSISFWSEGSVVKLHPCSGRNGAIEIRTAHGKVTRKPQNVKPLMEGAVR